MRLVLGGLRGRHSESMQESFLRGVLSYESPFENLIVYEIVISAPGRRGGVTWFAVLLVEALDHQGGGLERFPRLRGLQGVREAGLDQGHRRRIEGVTGGRALLLLLLLRLLLGLVQELVRVIGGVRILLHSQVRILFTVSLEDVQLFNIILIVCSIPKYVNLFVIETSRGRWS